MDSILGGPRKKLCKTHEANQKACKKKKMGKAQLYRKLYTVIHEKSNDKSGVKDLEVCKSEPLNISADSNFSIVYFQVVIHLCITKL